MRPLFISMEVSGAAYGILSPIIRDISRKIDEDNFDITPYSADIKNVGIIINCHEDSFFAMGFGKPRRYIRYDKGTADIRLPAPYRELVEADDRTRYLMAVKNITDSVAAIGERCRNSKRAQFDSEGMTAFILGRLGISSEELDGIHGTLTDKEYRDFMNGA